MLVISRTPAPRETLLDDTDIATLPDRIVQQMTRDELITIVRSCPTRPLQCKTTQRLEFYDKPTLRRLAFLVRRCCQQRLTRQEARMLVDDQSTP